ncbi:MULTISPECIES: hypothetical protein [unclassified Providencia]|uniref:hypothetical protein n=1 Tax=unclassified Providencia TaxID=2633465 RepID=UPI00234B14EA|nr:hypothetical protein [Providencia sp. PROV024]ELR5271130.1 hypothetical protein [Providencia rettgeri]WOC05481.1 hypothetical protein P3L56_06820 [Providencia sp. PROV024]
MKLTMEQAIDSVFEELFAMDSIEFVKELKTHKGGDVYNLINHFCKIETSKENEIIISTFLRDNSAKYMVDFDAVALAYLHMSRWSYQGEPANDEQYAMAA